MSANEWDDIYEDTAAASPVDPHLQALAPKLEPGTALDLGCGAGQNSVWLASQGWTVIGVDFARNAITQAKAAAEQAAVDVSFVVGDLVHWEPGSTYDLVVSTYALPHEGPGRSHALRMAADAVAPGGTLLISEFDKSLADEGWMASDDLTSVGEILGHLDGFDVGRAEVETTRHAHGDHERHVPVAVVIATRRDGSA